MSEKRDDTFLARWLNDELTEEEKRKFEASAEYSRYQKIVAASDNITPEDFDLENMLYRVKATGEKELPQPPRRKVLKLWIYGVAAAIALIIGFFFMYDQDTTLRTGFGEQQAAVLPDGSEIMLNSRSSVIYNKGSWADERSIELEGEAYFSVQQGSKFTVTSAGGNVTVLGTEFNVQYLEGLFQVTCYEGRVSVVTGKSEQVLVPGNSFRSVNGEESLLASDDTQPGWMMNESRFKSVPLKYVLLALSNQFDLEFEYNELDENILFTGSFPHSDEGVALRLVLGPLQLNYEKRGSRTVVLKK